MNPDYEMPATKRRGHTWRDAHGRSINDLTH
jgi:hypothetical protein